MRRPRRRAGRIAVGLIAAAMLPTSVGCTGPLTGPSTDGGSATRSLATGDSSSAAPAGPGASPGATTARSPGGLAGPSSPPLGSGGGDARVTTTPLGLFVHRSRPARNVAFGVAERVVSGEVATWAALGQGAGEIRVITGPGLQVPGARREVSDAAALARAARDPHALAVVPAGAATPLVRALPVGGRHPLRSPEGYPLRTAGDPPGTVAVIAVAGDVMLGRRVGASLTRTGDFARPLRPMAQRLAAADVTIANLESTLSRDGSPTQGGDSFAADPRVARGLRLAGVDVLSLANNHVGDWGARALVQTVDRVAAMGIRPVGAGRTLAQARRPAVVTVGDVRIGVLATDSIGESPAANRTRPGTNRIDMPPRTGPLDRAALGRVQTDIAALRTRVDLVIVVTHWGTQYTHRAEAVQRQVGQAMVKAGADLVVGGHPHWVQGVDLVDPTTGSMVVHSLGNFVFDMDFMRRTQEGLLLEAVTWQGKVKAVEFVPYVIGADFAPRVVTGSRAQDVLEPFRRTSDAPFDAG